MYLARIRFNRPVRDVQLPDRLVTVTTSDGDVLVPGETFDALRDSMLGVSYAIDVGPDLRDVPLNRLRAELGDDLADLAYEVTRVLEQVSRPRTNLGNSGPPGRID